MRQPPRTADLASHRQGAFRNAGAAHHLSIGEWGPTLKDSLVPSYREEVEAEFVVLARDFLDGVERHYGTLPQIDVFGVVAAVNYTPADVEPDHDQAFSHDAVSFRFSDQKPWVQVGVLRAALRLAESDD